jgi:hypothetical protein
MVVYESEQNAELKNVEMEPQDVVALLDCLRLGRGDVIVVGWSRTWSLMMLMFLIRMWRWLRRIHSVCWRLRGHLLVVLVVRHPVGPKDHRLLDRWGVLI